MSVPGSTPILLRRRWWWALRTSLWVCSRCGQLDIGQDTALASTVHRMLSKLDRKDAGKSTAELSKGKVGKPFNIIASQKKSVIFWARRPKIDAPTTKKRMWVTVQAASCLCHSLSFGSCLLCISCILCIYSFSGLWHSWRLISLILSLNCFGFEKMF